MSDHQAGSGSEILVHIGTARSGGNEVWMNGLCEISIKSQQLICDLSRWITMQNDFTIQSTSQRSLPRSLYQFPPPLNSRHLTISSRLASPTKERNISQPESQSIQTTPLPSHLPTMYPLLLTLHRILFLVAHRKKAEDIRNSDIRCSHSPFRANIDRGWDVLTLGPKYLSMSTVNTLLIRDRSLYMH